MYNKQPNLKKLSLTLITLVTTAILLTITISYSYLEYNQSEVLSLASGADESQNYPSAPDTELYTFGDKSAHAFFLEAAGSGSPHHPGYTLALQPSGLNVDPIDDLTCSQPATSISTPPPGALANLTKINSGGTLWQNVAQWLNGSTYEPYVVEMWVPANTTTSEFTLVSGDGNSAFANCLTPVDEDV